MSTFVDVGRKKIIVFCSLENSYRNHTILETSEEITDSVRDSMSVKIYMST